MLLGFDLPTRGALASPETITRLAIEGEAMGFDYLTLSDHIVIPRDIEARYPLFHDGRISLGRPHRLVRAANLRRLRGGQTTRLRMVTSVMVVPHRPAVLTAKMLATVDLLSNGRLTVGVGAGWMKEEFEAVGTPPFAERGAVTDEYMAAFRELWNQGRAAVRGPLCPLQQHHHGAQAGAEAASAALGRRRKPARACGGSPSWATAGIRSAPTPRGASAGFDAPHAGRHRAHAPDGRRSRARSPGGSPSAIASSGLAPTFPPRRMTASGGCSPWAGGDRRRPARVSRSRRQRRRYELHRRHGGPHACRYEALPRRGRGTTLTGGGRAATRNTLRDWRGGMGSASSYPPATSLKRRRVSMWSSRPPIRYIG